MCSSLSVYKLKYPAVKSAGEKPEIIITPKKPTKTKEKAMGTPINIRISNKMMPPRPRKNKLISIVYHQFDF